ncbi:MAG: glycosyltransferase family 2 protein [Desulfobacterales bacterium]|jgi:glycosyltransferase involved in cell wall biosynthesis
MGRNDVQPARTFAHDSQDGRPMTADVNHSQNSPAATGAPAGKDNHRRTRFAVVIPVYNHALNIEKVARQALKLGYPVIVVDDGSTDQTREIVRRIPGIHRLRHAVNVGKGAALQTGFEAAAAMAGWAITIDADGQHRPEEAVRLAAAAQDGPRAIVLGRREGMIHRQVPWTSRFGRGFSNFWVRAAGGGSLTDSQSGFRVYPLPEVFALKVKARRFQFEVEVLAKAGWLGLPVREVPVSVDYHPGAPRVSHFRPFIDFCRNTGTFARLIFQRVVVPRAIRRRRLKHPGPRGHP